MRRLIFQSFQRRPLLETRNFAPRRTYHLLLETTLDLPPLKKGQKPPKIRVEHLILTLKLDARSEELLETLRARYIPKHRRQITPHVVLYHALPVDHLDFIKKDIESTCARSSSFNIFITTPLKLGCHGVGLNITSSEASSLHNRLLAKWKSKRFELTEQDLNPWSGTHVILQNKVSKPVASMTLQELEASWKGETAVAQGLRLWTYKYNRTWRLLLDEDFKDVDEWKKANTPEKQFTQAIQN